MEAIGERIRRLRKLLKITQDVLAESIDTNRVTIARYESGEREPSNANLIKLADYFNVSTDYLLGRIPMEIEIIHGEAPTKGNDVEEMILDKKDLERSIEEIVDAALKKRGL